MHHYVDGKVKVLIVSKSSSEQFLFLPLSMKFSATNLIFTWKLFRQEYSCVIRICGRKFLLLVHGEACDETFSQKFIKYSHHTNGLQQTSRGSLVGEKFPALDDIRWLLHNVDMKAEDGAERDGAAFIHETGLSNRFAITLWWLGMRRTVYWELADFVVRKLSLIIGLGCWFSLM